MEQGHGTGQNSLEQGGRTALLLAAGVSLRGPRVETAAVVRAALGAALVRPTRAFREAYNHNFSVRSDKATLESSFLTEGKGERT